MYGGVWTVLGGRVDSPGMESGFTWDGEWIHQGLIDYKLEGDGCTWEGVWLHLKWRVDAPGSET